MSANYGQWELKFVNLYYVNVARTVLLFHKHLHILIISNDMPIYNFNKTFFFRRNVKFYEHHSLTKKEKSTTLKAKAKPAKPIIIYTPSAHFHFGTMHSFLTHI
jgi:hypothetical protein